MTCKSQCKGTVRQRSSSGATQYNQLLFFVVFTFSVLVANPRNCFTRRPIPLVEQYDCRSTGKRTTQLTASAVWKLVQPQSSCGRCTSRLNQEYKPPAAQSLLANLVRGTIRGSNKQYMYLNTVVRGTASSKHVVVVVVVVVFTLKAVPVSTQYFLTSVLVQLTRTPSVVTG